MLVLGIETSCDESGVALYCSERGLLGHTLYSQIKLHAEYGGVVPELASRDHIRKTLPLIRQLFDDCGVNECDVSGVFLQVKSKGEWLWPWTKYFWWKS